MPTRRHADTPTRRHADTPTRRHADWDVRYLEDRTWDRTLLSAADMMVVLHLVPGLPRMILGPQENDSMRTVTLSVPMLVLMLVL